jgi:acetylornithine deacetylase/succinyl-diaminopimelate desuccinylase-like protein
VPDTALLEGVMGFLPNKTGKDITAEIRHLLQNSSLAGRYKLEFTVQRDPSVTDRRSRFLEQISSACQQAGCSVELSALTACCDAWFYTQQRIPAVIFGPGSLKQAHSANESIPISQIALAAEALVRLALEA